jgi:Copper type II ascorbate-dependent monooxygenase, C-terminal domain
MNLRTVNRMPMRVMLAVFGLCIAQACDSNANEMMAAPPTLATAGQAAPVAPLAPNAQHHDFEMDSFDVATGAEFYQCQDIRNPFARDIAIVHSESNASNGTHHIFAFQITRDESMLQDGQAVSAGFACPSGGLEFHPYFHLAQRPTDTIDYPEGVARSLKAEEVIRLNVHYFNVTDQPITVHAKVAIDYVEPQQAKQLAAWFFVAGQSIMVPPGKSVQPFSYEAAADMNFLQITGHMHHRGQHFEAHALADSGDQRALYASDTWDEPETKNLLPAFTVKQGEKLEYACQFDNDSDRTLVYGESAETNEMCNMFGVFYPADNGEGVGAAL